jgi:hypothetical protein
MYAAKRLGRNAWMGYSVSRQETTPRAPAVRPELIEAWVADGRLQRERSADPQERAVA